jgi:hypothetical protein
MIITKLKAHPEAEGVHHSVHIIPAVEGVKYPHKISDIYDEPLGRQREMYCPVCDALTEMPVGSFADFLRQHVEELGGEEALVEIAFHHKGPRPATPPQRYKRVDTIRLRDNLPQ